MNNRFSDRLGTHDGGNDGPDGSQQQPFGVPEVTGSKLNLASICHETFREEQRQRIKQGYELLESGGESLAK